MKRKTFKKRDLLPRELLSSIGTQFAWQELEDLKDRGMMSFWCDGVRINIWPVTMTVAVQFTKDGNPEQIFRKNITESELREVFADPTARIGKEKHVRWDLSKETDMVGKRQARSKAKRTKTAIRKKDSQKQDSSTRLMKLT